MERLIALLVLFAGAAVVMGAAVAVESGSSEVPIHYTDAQPIALQHADADAEEEGEGEEEAPAAAAETARFAEAEGEAESESEYDVVVPHEVDHVEKTPHIPNAKYDEFVSYGALPPVQAPWKAPSKWADSNERADRGLSEAEDKELAKVDTVMSESTNTMTQSARCLMYCANGHGLCTRTNKGGCACAAGCMCNRGEAEATCSQHCHPDNQMHFVYGYHDANHFSPHLWGKTIGDEMSDYGQVRACLAGCAKRGKCKPRFCPRHPSGGYKCDDCKRLNVVPKHNKSKRYYTIPSPSRDGHIDHVVHVEHGHNDIDAYGHIVRHSHTHTQVHHHYPVLMEAGAQADAEGEAEAETEAEADAEVDAEAESEIAAEQELEAEAETDSEADIEAEAQAEAEQGFVHVTQTPLTTVVTNTGSNIRRHTPRTIAYKGKAPLNGADYADNGIVSPYVPQDPLAAQIDCNFYDCTGMQSEPYVPAGSLNPVIPYRRQADTRTTTFSTVPDMLEPRAEAKFVVVA